LNLLELRAEIEAHPKTIRVEDLPDEDYGDHLFWKITFETGVNEADRKTFCVIVDERGEAEEQAWFEGYPFYARSTEFRDIVQMALDDYLDNHAEIEYAVISNVDEEKRVSFIDAYTYDPIGDVVNHGRYVVWEKSDLSLGLRKVVYETPA